VNRAALIGQGVIIDSAAPAGYPLQAHWQLPSGVMKVNTSGEEMASSLWRINNV